MSLAAELALLAAGVAAGLASTVASLASVVSYPALLAAGLSPVSANVTNTVALVFTAAGAAAGSRPELAGRGRLVGQLGLVTAAGGAAGAALLLLSPPHAFQAAAPVLIAAASVLLLLPRRGPAAGPAPAAGGAPGADPAPAPAALPGPASGADPAPAAGPVPARGAEIPGGPRRAWLLRAAAFAVAVYVGYFGAAGGIMMLAVLSAMLAGPLAQLNAVKNVVSGLANAAAAVGFAIFGPVRWAAAVPLAAGFLVGGRIGPVLVRRLPQRALRLAIAVAGLVLAAVLAVRTYR